MADETHQLEIAAGDREAIVLCLALGTLEAIRGDARPLEAGIWTLGRPCFWEPLVGTEVAAEVIEVLQSSDELSAMALLCGRPDAEALLDRMISTIRSRLTGLPQQSWHASWSSGNDA